MIHAKDYIDARTQHAKDSMPGIKVDLEQLIDNSKAEFIVNGKIDITDEALSERLCTFFAQSYGKEPHKEFCDWLEGFGWELRYKNKDSNGNDDNPHRPNPKSYILSPTEYRK